MTILESLIGGHCKGFKSGNCKESQSGNFKKSLKWVN